MTIELPLEIPVNLDDLTIDPDELQELGKRLNQLSQYAAAKSSAMRHRLNGFIESAVQDEARCERIYSWLPEEWRW